MRVSEESENAAADGAKRRARSQAATGTHRATSPSIGQRRVSSSAEEVGTRSVCVGGGTVSPRARQNAPPKSERGAHRHQPALLPRHTHTHTTPLTTPQFHTLGASCAGAAGGGVAATARGGGAPPLAGSGGASVLATTAAQRGGSASAIGGRRLDSLAWQWREGVAQAVGGPREGRERTTTQRGECGGARFDERSHIPRRPFSLPARAPLTQTHARTFTP